MALAGPANRQGRIAADVIAGRDSRYRGTQGTSIIGLFGGAAAWTGVSEKTLKRLGDKDYEKIYLFPNSHAGYYPGAKMLGLKFIFRKSNGRVLGAQMLGEDGPAVDKRISALAMAIQMGATIYDLEEAELCYAPQFGSAKDPVNFAGMVAADVLRGDMPLSSLGFRRTAHSSWTCASRWNWSWRACRARSTSRWASSARASANFPATARSTSSAAPPSAPTTRRASCCRTDSKPKHLPAARCRAPCCPSRQAMHELWQTAEPRMWNDLLGRASGPLHFRLPDDAHRGHHPRDPGRSEGRPGGQAAASFVAILTKPAERRAASPLRAEGHRQSPHRGRVARHRLPDHSF